MKKLFLLDMDGTIYLGEQLFEGTAEFLAWIKNHGGQYAFLTNNSSRGIDGYLAKMERLGIPQSPKDFLTSVDATIDYLKEHYPKCSENAPCTDKNLDNKTQGSKHPGNQIFPSFYVCGTENFKSQLRTVGLNVLTESETEKILRFAQQGSIPVRPKAGKQKTPHPWMDDISLPVLLLGFDTELTYQKLEICVRLLNCGADYIATHPDLTCPAEYGNAPDIGLVIHDLEVCAGRKPVIIGKPQPQMVFPHWKNMEQSRKKPC